jgi:hypothetical protein
VHICKWLEDLKRLDKPVVTGGGPVAIGSSKYRRLFVGTWIIVRVAVFHRIFAVVLCVQMTIRIH